MTMVKELPSLACLHGLLDYCPETGELRWKPRDESQFEGDYKIRNCKIWNANHAGKLAGSVNNGYISVRFNNKSYQTHRIIWKMHNGSDLPFTDYEIDHIDGNRMNNKIDNLRLATRSENGWNITKAGANSASGIRGVSWDKRRSKWESKIHVGGHKKFLGYFNSVSEAEEAYIAARFKYHGEFVPKSVSEMAAARSGE